MQAIILAAGMGKRLKGYTQDITKCMVKLNGKALIEYTIESLIRNNISRLVIVTGYKSNVLMDYISSKFNESNLNGMKIEYIDNPIYDSTNNIYSFYLAKDELLKEETLLLESDLIYTPELIASVVSDKNQNAAVVSKYEPWMDGTCTILDSDNRILKFIDKKHFRREDADSYYKTVNIYKFSPDFCKTYYIPFLEAYQNAFGRNDYYEQILNVLSYIQPKIMAAVQVPASTWYEIDTPEDLKAAEEKFKEIYSF